jgi:hypothetical protein
VAGEEGEKGLELLDGLVELPLAIVRLADEEARPGSIAGLRMSLDHLAERQTRVLVPLLGHLELARRVQLGGGRERRRPRLEEVRHPPADGGTTSEQQRQREKCDREYPGRGVHLCVKGKGRPLQSQGH